MKTVRKTEKKVKNQNAVIYFAWTFVNGPEKLHKKKQTKKLTFPFMKLKQKSVKFKNGFMFLKWLFQSLNKIIQKDKCQILGIT